MAIADLDPMFNGVRGNIGSLVFYKRYGTLCVRSCVKPCNPNSPAQMENRRTFAQAVKSWQLLSREEKNVYNTKARKKPLSGYNLYISEYLKNNLNHSAVKSGVSRLFREGDAYNQFRTLSVPVPFHMAYGFHSPVIKLNYPEG